jgi:hypothetical protein
MFSTCSTIALIQALRDWEAKGARLPETVRVEVEYLEQELTDFERETGDPFEIAHNAVKEAAL